MTTRECFFTIFSVLINEACLQDTVHGFLGRSAVLPCSSADSGFKSDDITVYWRHNSSHKVLGINGGKSSIEEQDSAYKNRAETFPNEYMKGNFSLKLSNLQYNDAGKYVCYITKSHENPSTELFITASRNHGEETGVERIVFFNSASYSAMYLNRKGCLLGGKKGHFATILLLISWHLNGSSLLF